MRAFEKKDIRLKAGLAAFAWAHRLRETFYGAMMPIKLAGETTEGYGFVSAMLARANERFAAKKEPSKDAAMDGESPPK
jgi:hypothetical protein